MHACMNAHVMYTLLHVVTTSPGQTGNPGKAVSVVLKSSQISSLDHRAGRNKSNGSGSKQPQHVIPTNVAHNVQELDKV